MCKSQVPYFLMWIMGAVMTIIGIIVIISIFYGSGGSEADVVMQGEETIVWSSKVVDFMLSK